jgi:hypothetical protein
MVQVSESLHAIASLQERERTLGEECRLYQASQTSLLLLVCLYFPLYFIGVYYTLLCIM